MEGGLCSPHSLSCSTLVKFILITLGWCCAISPACSCCARFSLATVTVGGDLKVSLKVDSTPNHIYLV